MSPKSIVFIKLSLICFCNQWSIAYFTEFDIQMKEIVLMKNSPKTTTRTCPWDNWYIVVKKIWTIQFYHMTYHINKISDLVSLSIRKCHKIASVCEDLAICVSNKRTMHFNKGIEFTTFYANLALPTSSRCCR